MSEWGSRRGEIVRIAGPVVAAAGLEDVRLYDVIRVGEWGLVGEVIRLSDRLTTIQVYEDTSGVRVGEPVVSSGRPLTVTLGPGLLGSVYDGLQRPLQDHAHTSPFLGRGQTAPALLPDKQWDFTPAVTPGQVVEPGSILGTVPESRTIVHRVLAPDGVRGVVGEVRPGLCTVADPIVTVRDGLEEWPITLQQRWPVRKRRPFRRQISPHTPLVTGTRVIDAFFPVAKGGAAIIPGGFGTGKTVLEHGLARWSDVDVVVYIGCGERGNEMADVLSEFPALEDPRSGAPLMDRTVLIANTSNMPVAAREASIYTGITIAEYYRDMGYDVLLLADSTSRWGEALREISGRLQEMPGEEGYPAYLATRLAEFYERSGQVVCAGPDEARLGSVTLVGAVSPPGGDFSEPMTQNSLRMVGAFWALDYDLSRRRHFPAINWARSYSLYQLDGWFQTAVAADWPALVNQAKAMLQEEEQLLEIVQLVGPDSLADEQRLLLAAAQMLREDLLQQSAYDETDRFSALEKTYWLLRLILAFYERATAVLRRDVDLDAMLKLPVVTAVSRVKETPNDQATAHVQGLLDAMDAQFAAIQATEPP